MARPAKGTMLARTLADGTVAFRLRFRLDGHRQDAYLHERRGCDCGCGGGWNERTARVELENVVARAQAGIWKPPAPRSRGANCAAAPARCPKFADYAARWFEAKRDGVLGERPLAESTCQDYRWRLRLYLLPFFGRYRLEEIDRDLCLAFKAKLLRDSRELRDLIEGGAVIRDRLGKPRRPLGPASIKKILTALRAILDEALEDELIDRNPARGRRMRVRVPKPKRTFLEIDELACVEEAAGALEAPLLRPSRTRPTLGSTSGRIAGALSKGRPPNLIAAELGLSKSTVSYHLKELGVAKPSPYLGRQAILTTLGRSGIRVGELCDVRVGHLRLHDPDGARLQIPDAKTEAGIREVQVSPDLVEQLLMHLDRLRRAGHSTEPEAWAFPNSRGGQLSRQRVAELIHEAAEVASERMKRRGMPPLPHVTPHTLRRTYISIALIANNFDVLWVMSQVGHADSKMTLDVYAQLQQRVKRSHGVAFDRLVREARVPTYAEGAALPGPSRPGRPATPASTAGRRVQ